MPIAPAGVPPDAAPSPITLFRPAQQSVPLVFASAHSGRDYPADFIAAGLTEQQGVNMNELYQIDVMSADNTARLRKEEILMALASIYAQQLQEIYQMQIARIPTQFNDASAVEGGARMNRYTLTVAVNALYTKEKAAAYYDTFQSPDIRVDTDTEA